MPADYEKIAEHCLRHKKISDKVLDQFLMPFIARREGMDRKMNAYTQKYLHIIRKMPKEFFPMAMGEYISLTDFAFTPTETSCPFDPSIQMIFISMVPKSFLRWIQMLR